MIRPANSVEPPRAEIQDRLIEHRLAKGLHHVLVEQLFSPHNIKYWQKNNGAGAGPRMTRQLKLAELPWPLGEVQREVTAIFAMLKLPVDIDQQAQHMRLHVSPRLFAILRKTMESMYANLPSAGIVTHPNGNGNTEEVVMDINDEPTTHVREVGLESHLVDRTTLSGPKSENAHPSDIGTKTVREPFRMDRTVAPLTQAPRQR